MPVCVLCGNKFKSKRYYEICPGCWINESNQIVLTHLLNNRWITAKICYQEYGIPRLAERVADLRKDGHKIEKIMFKGHSIRQGKIISYPRYRLVPDA